MLSQKRHRRHIIHRQSYTGKEIFKWQRKKTRKKKMATAREMRMKTNIVIGQMEEDQTQEGLREGIEVK
jgi:hypothetical protein